MSIIKIDFSKDVLLWFETPKSKQVIDSLIKAIQVNTSLPLFNVFSINENFYSLCPYTSIEVNWEYVLDWWHHRAIAYYLTKWYVYANLIDKPKPSLSFNRPREWYIDIKTIPIIDNEEQYQKRIKRYKNYL